MHRDMRPMTPWRDGNPLLVPGAFVAVHLWCLVLGLVGAVALAFRVWADRGR
jgi:hypothetical protein